MYTIQSIKDLYEVLIKLNIVEDKRNFNWLNINNDSLQDNTYYFRGQSSKYKMITSTLSRNENYVNNEEKIYNEVMTVKKSDFCNCRNYIEILAKFQHYGIPTRLIDFTKNPLIALFFAVQNDLSEDDSIVYVCKNTIEDNSICIDVISYLAFISKNLDNIEKYLYTKYNFLLNKDEILNMIDKVIFVDLNIEENNDNFRLINQNGVFALCGNNIENTIKNIEGKNIFCKIIIPRYSKALIKAELDVYYDINESFVYPEMMTYANYIKTKYNTPNSIHYAYSQIKDIFNKVIKRAFNDLKITILAKLYLLKTTSPKLFYEIKTLNDLTELQKIVEMFLYISVPVNKYHEFNTDFFRHWVNYEPVDIYNYELSKYFDFFESIELAEKTISTGYDSTGKCVFCGSYFVVTEGEKAFYIEKGVKDFYFIQCPYCRARRKSNYRNNNF